MVSSAKPASSVSELVAKVRAVCAPPCKGLIKERVPALQMFTRWCLVLLLPRAWCVECPSGLHKSSYSSHFPSFPALHQPLRGFPSSPLHLETKPGTRNAPLPLALRALPLLFEFPKCKVVGSCIFFYFWRTSILNETRSQLYTGILKHHWFLFGVTTKTVNAACLIPPCSPYFSQKSKSMGWFKFVLGSWGPGSWPRGIFAALS